MITSKDNHTLKELRKLLHDKRHRARTGLFAAEGEDLVDAAAAAGWQPEALLVAGEDVEPHLLEAVSALGSGARAVGIYRQRWAEPGGALSVYLHAVSDPGNVGAVIRSAHAFAGSAVVLGPGCADPFGPKAVRASMGSLFARPPARAAGPADLPAGTTTVALVRRSGRVLRDLPAAPPEAIVLGAEREGLPDEVLGACDERAEIALRADGPDSLNVAMAATVALYERTRMALDAA